MNVRHDRKGRFKRKPGKRRRKRKNPKRRAAALARKRDRFGHFIKGKKRGGKKRKYKFSRRR